MCGSESELQTDYLVRTFSHGGNASFTMNVQTNTVWIICYRHQMLHCMKHHYCHFRNSLKMATPESKFVLHQNEPKSSFWPLEPKTFSVKKLRESENWLLSFKSDSRWKTDKSSSSLKRWLLQWRASQIMKSYNSRSLTVVCAQSLSVNHSAISSWVVWLFVVPPMVFFDSLWNLEPK